MFLALLAKSAISSSDWENLTCKLFFLLSLLPFDFKLDSFLVICRVLIRGGTARESCTFGAISPSSCLTKPTVTVCAWRN